MSEGKMPLPPAAPKSGFSAGAKVAIGCVVVVLVGMIAVCGGIAYLGWWGWQKIDSFGQEFAAKGYKRQIGQVIEVTAPIDEPTVFTGQVVRVTADVNADVAFGAQVVEIHSQVNGDIDFAGQVLQIQPGAVVKGNIRVRFAQAVVNQGTVEGEITGDYGVLQDAEGTPATPPAVEHDDVAPSGGY